MVNEKNHTVDYRAFESKFARGEYISPGQLEGILERERELDEHALDNNAPSAMPSPWQRPRLSHEEYFWLKENHPEYTAAYEKEMSSREEKIMTAVMIVGGVAVYGGIGYGIYKLINFFLNK
ncbi:hypothetical protein FJZ19_01620 [Candidatus Pacearchaeota archaeon]|nr:hypothetical protein [Candidatus Pacearchaeota archaeon]